ncbi:UNVERIFIED_ORG: hypothetical protein ABRZ91_002339 [Heyndrickxia coagulans]
MGNRRKLRLKALSLLLSILVLCQVVLTPLFAYADSGTGDVTSSQTVTNQSKTNNEEGGNSLRITDNKDSKDTPLHFAASHSSHFLLSFHKIGNNPHFPRLLTSGIGTDFVEQENGK